METDGKLQLSASNLLSSTASVKFSIVFISVNVVHLNSASRLLNHTVLYFNFKGSAFEGKVS
jgi:hypothetical protein